MSDHLGEGGPGTQILRTGGRFPDIHQLGDLRVRISLYRIQIENRPEASRERTDHLSQFFGLQVGNGIKIGNRLWPLFREGQRFMDAGWAFQEVQRRVNDDPPDPGPQLPGTPVLTQSREYPDKGFLEHILRIRLRSDVSTTNPQHDLCICVIQRPLRPGIPAQTVTHQILLGMHVVLQQGDKRKIPNVA